MSLLRYTTRRILATIPILFGVLLLAFVITRAMPGNPFLIKIGNRPSATKLAIYNKEVERLGLNEPVLIQFYIYFTNAMGPFLTWFIFIFIAGYIAFFAYKGIRLGYQKLFIAKNPQKVAV